MFWERDRAPRPDAPGRRHAVGLSARRPGGAPAPAESRWAGAGHPATVAGWCRHRPSPSRPRADGTSSGIDASARTCSAATAQTVATTMQAAALGKQIFDITDSTLALGLLGLVEFLPALILLPLTGSVADRFDRRRVAAIALAAEVVTSVLYCRLRRHATRRRRCRSSSSPRCSARRGRSPPRRSARCRR